MKNKKILIIIMFVACIGLIGGTLAYLTSSSTFTNKITTGTYSTSITEEFISPDNWTPGTTTNKKVNVTNDGNVEVAVRAKYTESWTAADGSVLSLIRDGENIAQFSVNSDWIKATDGYYYYEKTLSSGETSTDFISSVTFNPNFTLKDGEDIKCTTNTADGKTTVECVNLTSGYAGAKYKLEITIETIQADQMWSYVKTKVLYDAIAIQGVPDNITSEYVKSATGINFKTNASTINGQGVYTAGLTLNEEYPIHYFRGNVTNNNVIFANYCWKIIRTTETGGVKMIYNGQPDDNGVCNNTTNAAQLTTKAFNSSAKSLAKAGYMYNTQYEDKWETYPTIYNVYKVTYSLSSSNFYYSQEEPTYNSTTGLYTLENPTQIAWSSNYSTLPGYYTCLSATKTSCSTVYYIKRTNSSNMFSMPINGGKSVDDYTITIGSDFIDNGNGTYSLVEPQTIKETDWYTNYANYKNYYICSNEQSTTCSDMYYLVGTENYYYQYIKVANNYLYGNSFTYDKETGEYTLVDTKQFWKWPNNYNTLDNNHYTCFNTTGKCSTIKYIYYTNSSNAYYIEIEDGKNVEDAIEEMLHTENINVTDSTVKAYIDDWYSQNMVDYSKYIENTVYCNDRGIYELGGWNPNGGSMTSYIRFDTYGRRANGTPSLECLNKNDAFTLSVSNGGKKGYGNNALTYPVGLIETDEVIYAGSVSINSSYYLYTNRNYWTLSPSYSGSNEIFVYFVNSYGRPDDYYSVSRTYGVRPVISLIPGIEYSDGDGSSTTPYIIEMN